MDIQATQAGKAYSAAKPALAPSENRGGADGPLAGTVKDFAAVLRTGEDVAQHAAVGKADPHTLVMALSQTELAVETAATLRDRVVEAYQEILRMPV